LGLSAKAHLTISLAVLKKDENTQIERASTHKGECVFWWE
jgi:hypothetical protein